MRYALLLAALLTVGCVQPRKHEDVHHLDRTLKKHMGALADPQVAFMKDSSHLLVQLATVGFRNMSEPVLTERARHVGQFVHSEYARAKGVDSVTVMYREKVRPGMWHIRHIRTFPVAALGNVTGPVQPPTADIQ